MSDMMDTLALIVDVLFGLTCAGAPFLLWNRSKPAALVGAASGAVLLVANLTHVVLAHAHDLGPTPVAIRMAYVLISGVRNLCFYAALFAVIVILARPTAEAPR